PAGGTRAAPPGPVLEALLRQRRPRCLPCLALGRARRCRQRSGGGPRPRPGCVARRCDARANLVRPAPPDDALDEPADVPAGHELQVTPAPLAAVPIPAALSF